MVQRKDDNLDEVRAIWPELNDDELRQARDNFRAYVACLWRIFKRQQAAKRGIKFEE